MPDVGEERILQPLPGQREEAVVPRLVQAVLVRRKLRLNQDPMDDNLSVAQDA